jgi:hypothetical protein
LEAATAYRRSIELEPDQGFSYCELVRSSKLTADQTPLLESMLRLVTDDRVNQRGLMFLHYGLGKGYDDLGVYESAMKHFDEANRIAYRLKFGEGRFDPERLSGFVDRTVETFSKAYIRRHSEGAEESDLPIFIVGMMRSGTTLFEQILSNHPDVEGAGERPFWLRRSSEDRTGASDLNLRSLTSEYLGELRTLFPSATRVTDKMPGNYRVLGLIASALPRAKIVHCTRNPVDTCLSIYMTPNRVPIDFANDRDNIVFAYRQYQRLMRHWEDVIGPASLSQIRYEEVVADPEPVVRQALRFCDLPWDGHCLHPEENDRSVVTPSAWQVRQPLYTSAVERWRRYEPWLGPFAELRTS